MFSQTSRTIDCGKTSDTYEDVKDALESSINELFFASMPSSEKRWLSNQLSKLRTFTYYDCLSEQIETIVELKDDVFFAGTLSAKAAWARRMVEKVINDPHYNCSISRKLRDIEDTKEDSGHLMPSAQAEWARKEIEKILN